MDFIQSDELAAHRAAAREWADANAEPHWAEEQKRSGNHQTMELHARLARDGLLGAGWPKEHGGTDVDPDFTRAVFDELNGRGMRADAWASTVMVLHTIREIGTEEQKRAYIEPALRGEVLIALGYSEPDSGSDVAAAKSTAVRDGDEWVINGQKMFTSSAQIASHVFFLARTSPDKYKGLTLFMVPVGLPGYDIDTIHTLGGQLTNATYYTDVRVPDSARIGDVDEGWGVMNVALVFERGAGTPSSLVHTVARDLADWSKQARRPDDSIVFDDPLVAERIGRIAVDEEVVRLFGMWMEWKVRSGALPGVESSMRKLFWSETLNRHQEHALDVLGAEGVLARDAPGVPVKGLFEHDFRKAVVTTIYGGASEILREVIAWRHLGLPRNRTSR